MSVKVITKDNFENEVMHSEKPVLLDFLGANSSPVTSRFISPHGNNLYRRIVAVNALLIFSQK